MHWYAVVLIPYTLSDLKQVWQVVFKAAYVPPLKWCSNTDGPINLLSVIQHLIFIEKLCWKVVLLFSPGFSKAHEWEFLGLVIPFLMNITSSVNRIWGLSW
jgi:hypothetical protein